MVSLSIPTFLTLCIGVARGVLGCTWPPPPLCKPSCMQTTYNIQVTIWWVPSVWVSVTPPLKNPGYAHVMGWVVQSTITETNPVLRSVYKGDFCRGNSMQFLSRLSCNFKIARVNQVRFSVRFVAAISQGFLTCSKLVATSTRQKLHRVAATKIAFVNGPLARILISILQLFGEVSSLYCLPFSCALY